MIAQLTGVVARSEGNSVILDVGGVGFQVFVPVPTLASLPEAGGKVTLLTHLVGRVQPDFDVTLYGFATPTELRAFKILLGVSGVGAKVALALLSTLDVAELARALSTNDTKSVTKVPGVGPKLAQRLCLELGDKMAAFAFEQKADRASAGQQTAQENAAYEDAVEGLIGLGYGRADVRRAVDRAFAAAADKTNASVLIRQALTLLTSGK
ncbi:MAG TPA: Holliday junction branch migration protein RuvA [Chthonomonadaceae bacterium]|nr:Holliday junction branch migration protein RuvA [Chthonomonadaceae bacterium]